MTRSDFSWSHTYEQHFDPRDFHMSETTPRQQRRGRGRPFQKGQSGNPKGRPVGARHKTTLAVEIAARRRGRRADEKGHREAKEGDVTALRLCLDRIAPPRRDRLTTFNVPPIRSAADAITAMGAIVEAVADGRLTSGEAANVSKLCRDLRVHDRGPGSRGQACSDRGKHSGKEEVTQ